MIPEVPLPLPSRSSSLRDILQPRPKSLKRQKSVKIMTPAEQRYKQEFKQYLDVKSKKEEFVHGRKKAEKTDWDKYVSPGKKAADAKTKTPQKAKVAVEISRPKEEHEEVLTGLSEKDKETFMLLRNLFNSLDPVYFFFLQKAHPPK